MPTSIDSRSLSGWGSWCNRTGSFAALISSRRDSGSSQPGYTACGSGYQSSPSASTSKQLFCIQSQISSVPEAPWQLILEESEFVPTGVEQESLASSIDEVLLASASVTCMLPLACASISCSRS